MDEFKTEYNFPAGEILLFDKDLDWTSFDLVQRVRNVLCRQLGIKKLKVGHAGTLDPLATGLMILCTGKATKKIELVQQKKKVYEATLKLGATTASFDMETEEDSRRDISYITQDYLQKVIQKFEGEIKQVPPVFSAVKVKGKRAFEFARKGEDLKLQPKIIVINEITQLSFEPPFITLRVTCSKGTYIRALARDIGKELGCGAYLTGLRRTQIGDFKVEDAMKIDFFMENLNQFVTKTKNQA